MLCGPHHTHAPKHKTPDLHCITSCCIHTCITPQLQLQLCCTALCCCSQPVCLCLLPAAKTRQEQQAHRLSGHQEAVWEGYAGDDDRCTAPSPCSMCAGTTRTCHACCGAECGMMLRCMPFAMLPHRRHKQHLLHARPRAPGSSLALRQAAMQQQQLWQQPSGPPKLLVVVVHHLLPQQQQQEGERASLWMRVARSTNGVQRARTPTAPQDNSSSSQPSHSSAAIHQSLSQQQRIVRSSRRQHSRSCRSAGLGLLAAQLRRQLPMRPRQLLLVPQRAKPKREQPPQTPGNGLLLSAASLLQQTQLLRPPPSQTAAATPGQLHPACWEAQQPARGPTGSQASCRRRLLSRGRLGLVAGLAAAEQGPMRGLLAGLWQCRLLPLTASSSTSRHLPFSATAWACRQADRW